MNPLAQPSLSVLAVRSSAVPVRNRDAIIDLFAKRDDDTEDVVQDMTTSKRSRVLYWKG